jgi:hypothetical protein
MNLDDYNNFIIKMDNTQAFNQINETNLDDYIKFNKVIYNDKDDAF